MKAIRETIRARLYGYGSARPRSVNVRITHFPTSTGSKPFVQAEEVLGTETYIHDCDIQTIYPRSTKRFRIYFTRHRLLPQNDAIRYTHPGTSWHGQLLVVRLADDGGRHVSLRRGDITFIKRLVKRYLVTIDQCRIHEIDQSSFAAELQQRTRIPQKLQIAAPVRINSVIR